MSPAKSHFSVNLSSLVGEAQDNSALASARSLGGLSVAASALAASNSMLRGGSGAEECLSLPDEVAASTAAGAANGSGSPMRRGAPPAEALSGPERAKAEYHHARGYSLRKQGNFRGAVEEYSAAISLHPRHFKALFNRGFSHDKLGEHARAVADYSAALAVEPANSYALYNRGITLDRMGNYEAATADFTAAIAQDPNNADFYHNRGFSLRKQVLGRGLQNCI